MIIQGLWIGETLNKLGILTIKSFLQTGHEFHLYTYGEVKNIPEGTTIKDGNEILPESEIFTYQTDFGKGSYSAFSNYFRYKLIYDKGGWYSDLDVCSLKKMDFEEEYVFSQEKEHNSDKLITTSGLFKAPKGCEIMKYCFDFCMEQDKSTLKWGVTGPRLVDSAVKKFKLEKYIKPYQVFCMIQPYEVPMFIQPMEQPLVFPDAIYTINLWNQAWKVFNMNMDLGYDETCLYEQLKVRFGV